ncbi:hypothetical protein BOTCAL_0185g00100 [Botryotinia calthae]|uniref:Uncharacterized protein n=1 Tax=Botryotinia calthae TaxID=38488 RepID=A0A4Y8D0W1_9HELO|nr:hypothetical protein BOTCAL_0185g00100 [Botryotinia calthae]
MAKLLFSLFSFLSLIIGVSAQFQFFEQMFNGQQQQQRQPQDRTEHPTSAREPSPASPSHTTVPARTQPTRKNSSSQTETQSAYRKEGLKPERLRGRWNWLGRG